MPITPSLLDVAFGTDTQMFANLRAEAKRRSAAAEAALCAIPISDKETAYAVYCFLLAVFGNLEIELDVDNASLSIGDGVSEVGLHVGPQISLWVLSAPVTGAQSLLHIVKTALESSTRPGACFEDRTVVIL
jgi:hypothetical protein